jgi:DNA-binding CsgD family transcriptional regulator
MLPRAYLTDRQLEVWRLRLRGLSKAEIGRRRGVSRQAVYDAEGVMLRKVEAALRHAAGANMIEVRHIDPTKGILLGYSPATKNRVIVTFSARNGVQTWHYEQPDCGACQWEDRCRNRLLAEAEERGIRVLDEERQLPPSKLAHLIFSRVIPGLTP